MASLTDDPRMTQQVQGARRDFSLLNRAYRMAKRRGDYGEALKYAQAGDSMGIPVGRVANDRVLEGAGRRRFQMGLMASGGTEQRGGLDGFDFRHSSQGGPGVGGYDFRQAKDRMMDAGEPTTEPGFNVQPAAEDPQAQMEADMGLNARPTTSTLARPSLDRPVTTAQRPETDVVNDPASLRPLYQRAWQRAKTQDQKDDVVARALEDNIPMNATLASEALARRRRRQRLLVQNAIPRNY